jgi:uncharacterized protein (TIGR03083 family)
MTVTAADGVTSADITAEFTELADTLAMLPTASWDAASLCEGWRTREVVAHLTMPLRYPLARFAFEMARARGDFARAADRCAKRDSSLAAGTLLAGLRDPKLHTWRPPGGGAEGALTHAVIHGLDITVPLGLDRQPPAARLRHILGAVSAPRALSHFGVDLSGVELRATDLDWSTGTGSAVSARAADLALVLCGRKLPPGRLTGDQAPRFTAAAPN